MTLQHEITKMYRRGEQITVDYYALHDYLYRRRDTIDVKVGETWVRYKPHIRGYRNYDVTISPEGYIKEMTRLNKALD